MDRVLQATAPTIYATFYVDGVATNPSPDSATVTITRADGTVLVASTAAADAGTGRFSYQLTTTHTALLDRLTVRWTSNLGTVTTVVEVVSGFLFSTAAALADDEITATAAEIAEARTRAERKLEGLCNVAFVPRYEYQDRWARANRALSLRWSKVRTIRSLAIDGQALTVGQIADLDPGYVWPFYWRSGTRPWGRSRVTVGYEHGMDQPPADADRAALRLAKHYLTDWTADDRALRLDTDTGSYVMSVPGRGGSHVGIPEVDEFVDENRYAPVAV